MSEMKMNVTWMVSSPAMAYGVTKRAILFPRLPGCLALEPNPAYCGWLESPDNRMEVVQHAP